MAAVQVLGAGGGDGVAERVVGDLRERGREVREFSFRAGRGGRGRGLQHVVDRMRTEVMAPSTYPAPSSVHLFGWRAVVAGAAARRPRGPALVGHLGDGPPRSCVEHLDGARLQRLVWAAARSLDCVVLDSQWAVEQALAAGVPRTRVVRGLPVAPPPGEDHAWTARRVERPRRVLAVGGVGQPAGTDMLLQAVGRLADVELVVAAPVSVTQAELRPAERWLRAESERLGVRRAVARLAPFSLDLLAECDLVVDAATTAGGSDGVVAAMSRRRAVLASDLGPKAEAVVPGTTGELVPPGRDWRAWCGYVVRLLRDPFKLEAYGDAGLERSRVGFAPSRRADLIDQVHAQLSRTIAAAC
ncbi:MAG: glycosyltransferase [Actinomycetes bacterium]